MAENTPTLETERLRLRRFSSVDLEAIFDIFSDEEVNASLPWYPVLTEKEARAFYKDRYASIYIRDRGYHYAICLKQDNIPIGYVNVSMEESHDLGYGLKKEFWRKGIVTEACKAVIAKVKADGLSYITATHDRENIRSGKVLQALGMSYKYSYNELWQPKNLLVIFRMYQLNLDGNKERVYKEYWDRYPNHFIEAI